MSDACLRGDEKSVQELLKARVNVNETNSDGYGALFYASSGGHTGVLRLLLDARAEVNARASKNLGTPLHVASVHGNHATCQVLLERGASPNLQDNSLSCPLHLACDDGHAVVVEVLLQHGADPSVPNGYGQTPLMFATEGHHLLVMEFLLECGGGVNTGTHLSMKNMNGLSAWDLARQTTWRAGSSLLLAHGAGGEEENVVEARHRMENWVAQRNLEIDGALSDVMPAAVVPLVVAFARASWQEMQSGVESFAAEWWEGFWADLESGCQSTTPA